MNKKSFAEYYHNETKYSPEGLAKSRNQIEWEKQPLPFKEYKLGEKIELAKYLKLSKERPNRKLTEEEQNLEKLSRLLYYSNGVTAIVPYTPPLLLRAAPSAGGLYPTEMYVIANNYKGLNDGIYYFNVRQHSIVGYWKENNWDKIKKACFNHPSFDETDLCIVFTGVFYRSAWRYMERAYRRILLDTGHVMGNLVTYAPFAGRYASVIGGFNDDQMNDLLWLDKNEEAVLGVVPLTSLKKYYDINTTKPSGISNEAFSNQDLIVNFHSSGNISSELPVRTPVEKEEEVSKFNIAFGETLSKEPLKWEISLEETILERRSTRAFSGESLSKQELSELLSFTYKHKSYENQGFDPHPEFFDASLIETYIAVTSVEGLEDGCYVYIPAKNELRQIRFKNFRNDLYYLCLGQELGRDASVVVFHTVNLPEAIEQYGERAYRYLHMDAGHLGQRLNLACTEMELGVSGIGGFFDDQVNELLGIPETNAVLYITTVGRAFSTEELE